MGKELTAQEELFRDRYLLTANVAESALFAGYAQSVATSAAYTWVSESKCPDNKRHLLNAILKARLERSKETKIDANWLLQRLAEEADADVADIYTEEGSLKPVHAWPKIWRQGLVSGIDTQQDYAYEDGQKVPDGVTVKVKLSDRIKRLELIGRHIDVGAFKDSESQTVLIKHIMPVPTCASVEDWEAQAAEYQPANGD